MTDPLLPKVALAGPSSPTQSEDSLPPYTEEDKAAGGFEEELDVKEKEPPSLKYTFFSKRWNDISLVEGGPKDVAAAGRKKDVAYYADVKGFFSSKIRVLKGVKDSGEVLAFIERQKRPGGEIEVELVGGGTYALARKGNIFSRSRYLLLSDGTELKWSVSFWGHFTLSVVSTKQVLARFTHKFWNISRRGTLEIWGEGVYYRDLIIASAIVMEVREEERRRASSGGGGGGGGG